MLYWQRSCRSDCCLTLFEVVTLCIIFLSLQGEELLREAEDSLQLMHVDVCTLGSETLAVLTSDDSDRDWMLCRTRIPWAARKQRAGGMLFHQYLCRLSFSIYVSFSFSMSRWASISKSIASQGPSFRHLASAVNHGFGTICVNQGAKSCPNCST